MLNGNRGSQRCCNRLSLEGVIACKAAGSELNNDFGARIITIWLLLKDIHNKDDGVFLVSAYVPVGNNAPDDVWNEYVDKLTIYIVQKCKSDILIIGTDAAVS